jgi:hypothetical protein
MAKYVNVMFEPCNHKLCSNCLNNILKDEKSINLCGTISCHLCRGKVETTDIKFFTGVVD